MLEKKSITELRGIAQAIGCKYDWSDDKKIIIQKIQLKQNAALPKPVIEVRYEQPHDQRLRTLPPSKVSNEKMIRDMLAPLIAIGLKFDVTGEEWVMRYDKREDSGNMRMPPRHILRAAERMML